MYSVYLKRDKKLKRIVISDTHIGSKFYKRDELLSFLSGREFDQLILAGDIIDFLKIPMFTERCSEIIKIVGTLTDVVYIVGNHDVSFQGLVGKTLSNIKFCRKYEFTENGRKFRIEHGDRFNKGFFHAATFVKIISVFQDLLERWLGFDFTSWLTARVLKKHKLRSISTIMKANKDVDVFIMGHTHIPEAVIWVEPDKPIKTYVNSGDWVSHSTYVEIDEGVVRLKSFKYNP